MKYIVNKDAKKGDFIREGFRYSSFNVLERRTPYLGEPCARQTVFTIDFTKEDTPIKIFAADSENNVYLMEHLYDVDKENDVMKREFNNMMDELVEKGLLEVKIN